MTVERALEAGIREAVRVNSRERHGRDSWADDAEWERLKAAWRENGDMVMAYDIPAKQVRAALAAFLRALAADPPAEMAHAARDAFEEHVYDPVEYADKAAVSAALTRLAGMVETLGHDC